MVHDIPVNVVPRRLWSEYTEPDALDPDVISYFLIGKTNSGSFKNIYLQISVYFPQLRLMKSIVERMKNLANMATLTITAEGSLTLTVETDAVSVTSHFDDLHVEKQSRCKFRKFACS